jgi:hypothetical protein
MLLQDSLHEAVADISANLPALADSSRRRGLALRRRRRALAAVGATTVATVLALGIHALVPGAGGGESDVATDIAAPVVVGQLSGRTAQITGRGAAAALADAVGDVADGTFGGFQGDAWEHEALGAFRFLPASGSGPAGLVMVNLQPLGMAGPAPYGCADPAWRSAMLDCHSRQLPDGDTLRTYRDEDTESGAGSQRLVAEVISPGRHLRVAVGAMNTNPYAGGEMRDAPVLTTEQLVEIATQPWWSRTRLPEEYVAVGAQLDDFTGATDAR